MTPTRTEAQLTAGAARFQRKRGWIPTFEQLELFMDSEPFTVGVNFAGSSREYHYIAESNTKVGDYLAVDSPMTNRLELVKVVDTDTGVSNSTKRAKPISWDVDEW